MSRTVDISSRVLRALRTVPDFPTPGVMFKDITPMLAMHELLADVVHAMQQPFIDERITHVVGIESRGFMFGVPIAMALQAAFVPARKPGKLPWTTVQESYTLEYRGDALEMHADAFEAGARVLIVDDVLATGGTAAAAARLVRRLGGEPCGVTVLAEISALQGRLHLQPLSVHAVVGV
jgi:adenine phosphoribosyltransferase